MSAGDTGAARRVIVIGGGVTGLAAAHRLVELNGEGRNGTAPPVEVLLIEASLRLGGTVRTLRREGFLLEAGPDAFITEKPAAVELARRLGLEERLIETNPEHRRSFVVRGGRLHPTPEGFHLLAPASLRPFVTSRIFTWRGKARMALDLLLPRRRNAEADESLASFVRRRFGREALERMAQPMVGGIYTADPELLSLRATMPRFHEMERRHRSVILALRARAAEQGAQANAGTSGARYGLFATFDEGMQTLTDALAARLPAESVRTATKVEYMTYEGRARGWVVSTNRDEHLRADAVLLALPAHTAGLLLRGVEDTDLEDAPRGPVSTELSRIPYASTATVNLAFRREDVSHPLDGFGFVVPHVERLTTLACTFSSVKFAGRAPDGQVLLRAFVGGALRPDAFYTERERMVESVLGDLRGLLGVRGEPLFSHVEKWPHSMAQYHVGHVERVERIRERLARLPTLRLAGNYLDGAGIPDCVRTGERAAEELHAALAGLPPAANSSNLPPALTDN